MELFQEATQPFGRYDSFRVYNYMNDEIPLTGTVSEWNRYLYNKQQKVNKNIYCCIKIYNSHIKIPQIDNLEECASQHRHNIERIV